MLNIFDIVINFNRWEDQIKYSTTNSSLNKEKLIESGSTMHVRSKAQLENNSSQIRIEVKVDRYGRCPIGYAKIRDNCRGYF